jgi:hypothetical protein
VSPVAWWEAEFWNKDVDRAIRIGRGPTYTPFPAERTSVDFETGRLRGSSPAGLLVLARNETRFALAHAAPLATARALALVRARGPDRLAWATRGAAADGWIAAHRRATIRVFAGDRPVRRDVRVTTTAPIPARSSHMYTFETGASRLRTLLGPGGRVTVRFVACPGAHDFAQASLGAEFSTRIRDRRVVSLHIDRIDSRAAPRRADCGSLRATGG